MHSSPVFGVNPILAMSTMRKNASTMARGANGAGGDAKKGKVRQIDFQSPTKPVLKDPYFSLQSFAQTQTLTSRRALAAIDVNAAAASTKGDDKAKTGFHIFQDQKAAPAAAKKKPSSSSSSTHSATQTEAPPASAAASTQTVFTQTDLAFESDGVMSMYALDYKGRYERAVREAEEAKEESFECQMRAAELAMEVVDTKKKLEDTEEYLEMVKGSLFESEEKRKKHQEREKQLEDMVLEAQELARTLAVSTNSSP